MATKADFTEQEWETMRKGVTGAGLLVAVADRGFFDSFKEAGTLAKHLAAARSETSDVIRELAETRGMGFGVGSSPDEVEAETLAALGSAVATLDAKAPEDAQAYRDFVVEVARSVADAAGGGDTAESGAIGKIQSALGAGAA